MGWVAYGPGTVDDDGEAPPDGDERLRLSDVGKLARRARRRIVRGGPRRRPADVRDAAAASTWAATLDDLDVVEESWPSYDHVNVQVGPRRLAGRRRDAATTSSG